MFPKTSLFVIINITDILLLWTKRGPGFSAAEVYPRIILRPYKIMMKAFGSSDL